MPDLHSWITQQIDKTQRIAEAARGQGEGRWHHETGYHSGRVTDERGETVVYDEGAPLEEAAHIALHDPAMVLRRCEADRRILARHRLNPDAYWVEAAMCEGCGTEGEMGYPVTENLNDCPELLDLAYAHGLTDEVLAGLDRPQEGERPERTGPSLIPDGLAEAMYERLYAMVLGARPLAPGKTTPSTRELMQLSEVPPALRTGAPPNLPDGIITELHAAIDAHITRTLIDGDSTGDMHGFRIIDAPPEPTPMDRALAFLDPHLRACPQYQAGPPAIYPFTWKDRP